MSKINQFFSVLNAKADDFAIIQVSQMKINAKNSSIVSYFIIVQYKVHLLDSLPTESFSELIISSLSSNNNFSSLLEVVGVFSYSTIYK